MGQGPYRVEVGYPYPAYRAAIHDVGRVLMLLTASVALAVLLFVPAFFRTSVLQPLSDLIRGVGIVDAGNLAVAIPVRSQDELGRLAGSFNSMVRSISAATDERERINAAYRRFVPADLLNLLDKPSILEVELGDQVSREVAVMFSDIRSFTTLSENMTPRENFRFLNSYLGRIAPIIKAHHGYIDKYLGDGVLAIFPRSMSDAAAAAIALQDAVAEYNRHRTGAGYQGIRVGYGLHAGEVMLGTIGGPERMDGTVVADVVNVAARIESLTKVFGADVLASGEVIAELGAEVPRRTLGAIQVKGKGTSVDIFEMLVGVGADGKLGCVQQFEYAVALMLAGEYGDALVAFRALGTEHPDDGAIAFFQEYCGEVAAGRVRPAQKGVISLDAK